tara:strand:+ start:819 stop:1595 length:777 start_codon:yes stop_codon:yes gene_type:complete
MVMPTDSQTEEPIQEVQAEAPTEEPTQDFPVEDTEVPVAPTEGEQEQNVQGELPLQEQPAPQQPVSEQPVQPEQPDPNIQAQIEELHRMKQVDAQQQWEQQVYRQAQALERRAQQQGVDPQSAREIAKSHVSSQKQLRDQQTRDYDLIRNIEGRNNASLHFLEKYGLADKQMLEDYRALSGFTTPQAMELEAKRMAQLRQQAQEIARLKQGQVKPQTFDNSQGAAEPTSNQDRLLQEYIAGQRSEAHQAAARRAAGQG